MWTIVAVGVFSVFFVFFVLYFIVILLALPFRRKAKVKVELEEEEKVVEEEVTPEIVVAIAAVLAQVMEGEYRIVSIKRVRPEGRGFETWEKTGWRGRRRWSESSEWS